MLTADLSSY